MRALERRLWEMIEPGVRALGCELVGVELAGGHRGSTLRVYIDREDGVTLEDCEQVSYQVSGILDVEDPIKGAYDLEVSSPGLDRPLFLPAHYERYAGHRARIRLQRPLDGRRNFSGELLGVADGNVLLSVDGERTALPMELIEKARLIPEE